MNKSCFFSVVGLLQAICTLWHGHGESTTQTAGCLGGLDDNRNYQNLGLMIAMERRYNGTWRAEHKQSKRKRETTGTPLCCTRWRQISKDLRAEWMFYFLIYMSFVGHVRLQPNRTFSQCRKGCCEENVQESDCKKNRNNQNSKKSSWLLTACSHFVDCCGCEFCITPYLGANGFRSCELCCPLWPGIYFSGSSWTFYFLRISQPFWGETVTWL